MEVDACRNRWYVLQTKPKQESRAESNLRSWGVETLAPKIQEWRRVRRAPAAPRVAPLFPNYLFARFDAALLAGKVRLTRGVQRLIGFGEYATPVDDSIIHLIQSRLSEDGCVRLPDLKCGDQVEIVSGPLTSLVGVFEREVPARDRVVILLHTIGSARVQVAKAAIRPTCRVA